MQRSAVSQLLFLSMLVVCRGASAGEDSSAASARGDYVGDCFKATGLPVTQPLTAGADYIVLKQVGDTDPALTLGVARKQWYLLTCELVTTSQETKTVQASDLIASGAPRVGYAYGALTMPYKYYPKTRTFSASAPIGAYLGVRRGLVGSGYTFAVALTLSSVKADTVDPGTLVDGKPAVTGSTDVAALSAAVGVMYDIMKSTTGKPFKAGLFVGVDRVNQSSTVSYPQNGKAWIALQLGYDFTDN